jgi:hypothetical protein
MLDAFRHAARMEDSCRHCVTGREWTSRRSPAELDRYWENLDAHCVPDPEWNPRRSPAGAGPCWKDLTADCLAGGSGSVPVLSQLRWRTWTAAQMQVFHFAVDMA